MLGVSTTGRRALQMAGFVLVCAVGAGVVLLSPDRRRERPLWDQYRVQLEQRGESLAWENFIPAKVKDEDNFFEAPEMKGWFSRQAASSNTASIFQLPPKVSGGAMTLLDLDALPEEPDANLSGSTRWPRSRQDVRQWVAQTESSYRVLANACLRPAARLNTDYSSPLDRMDRLNFAAVRSAAQALATRASLHWLDQQPGEALDDLRILQRVADLTASSPTLVGGMIHVAVWRLYANSAADALQSRALHDVDLLAVQKGVQMVNLMDVLTHSLRAERAIGLKLLNQTPREIDRVIFQMLTPNRGAGLTAAKIRDWLDTLRLRSRLRVGGWVDRNVVLMARSFQEMLDAVDSSRERVQAQLVTRASNQIMRNLSGSPDSTLASMLVPNLTRAVLVAARAQTLLNQLQTACGLERYRRARGEYPESLEQLVPEFLGVLPRDLFVEGSLRYRRTAEGSYRLWSVGWNEQDDGGAPGPLDWQGQPAFSEQVADWVWPATPRVPAK